MQSNIKKELQAKYRDRRLVKAMYLCQLLGVMYFTAHLIIYYLTH